MLVLIPVNAYAGWYNNSWKSRSTLIINSTSAVTNAQLLLTPSISGTLTLISEGKLNADLSDVRFTDKDGVTLINYWIPPDASGIIVKVPALLAGKNVIYMYYGNPSASDASSFEGTMGLSASVDMQGLYNFNFNGTDTSGKGNNMNLFAAAFAAKDVPKWKTYTIVPTTGSSMMFDGLAAHGQIPANATLNTSKSLTVAFWINPDDFSVAREVIRKDDYPNTWKIFFPLDSGVPGRIEFSAKSRSLQAFVDNKVVAGQWTHVAATFDAVKKEMKIYINGNLEATKSSIDDIGADSNILIQLSGSVTMKGSMDELVISGRAYTLDEVKALHARMTPVEASFVIEQPQEISKFTSTPQIIRPGGSSKFSFTFTEKMNTAVIPTIYVWLSDNSRLAITGAWVDEYTYTATYLFPAATIEGFSDMALTDAVTAAGRNIGDYKTKMVVGSASLIPENKKEFWPNPFSPNGDGFADKTTLFLNVDKASDVKVTIFDLRGTVIRYLFKGTINGNNNIEWDGKDNSGEMAKIGLYIYQLEIGSSITSGSIVLTK